MPKGSNQKLKLYYLSRIMTEKTDDEHHITMPEIQRALEDYGVTADRKNLYDDLEALRVLGIDVIGEKNGRSYSYQRSVPWMDLLAGNEGDDRWSGGSGGEIRRGDQGDG